MIAALAVVAADLVGATQKSSSSSSSAGIFYLFILIAVAFYFLILRPQQRKAKAMREQQNVFEVGDEVLTAGGLVGSVIDIDGDRVTLETSVGASFVVLRQYVLRKLEPPAPSEEDDADGQLELVEGTEEGVHEDDLDHDAVETDDLTGHEEPDEEDPGDLDGHGEHPSRGPGGPASGPGGPASGSGGPARGPGKVGGRRKGRNKSAGDGPTGP